MQALRFMTLHCPTHQYQNLRYKDYQLASRPAALVREEDITAEKQSTSGLHELDSVKEFGQAMRYRGVYTWWRKGMGYAAQDELL